MSVFQHKGKGYSLRHAVAAMVPFVFVFIALFVLAGHLMRDISTTRMELEGLHDIHTLQDLFLNLQALRGTANIHSGPEKESLMKVIDKLRSDEHSLIFGTKAQADALIRNVMRPLQGGGAPALSDDYDEIVREIKGIKLVIANQSRLILDNERDSYHIIQLLTEKIPGVIDSAGKVEWLTGRFLDGETEHMFLHSEMDALGRILTEMKMSEEAFARSSSALKPAYRSVEDSLMKTGQRYLRLIDRVLHGERNPGIGREVSSLNAQLADESMDYYRQASAALEDLLEKRLLRFRLMLLGGAALLLASVGFTLFVVAGFYRSNRFLSSMNAELDEANALLRENEEKFRTIFEMAVDGILVADAGTRKFITSNAKFREKTGYSNDDLVKMSITDIHPRPELPVIIEQFERQSRREIQVAADIPVLCKDGSLFYADINSAPVMIGDRKCLVGIFRDISDRKNAEQALFEANRESMNIMEDLYYEIEERKIVESELRKLTVAVEQNPASIIITNPEGRIEYVNPHFTETTGYSMREVIGQNPRLLKSGKQPDAFYKELWETIVAGKTWTGDFLNKKKNGELYWESASISPIKDGEGNITHFIAIETDITERRVQEETIKRQQHEEEVLNRILALSIEELAFDVLIGRCLDEVLSIPFIPIQSKGAIFTVDEGKDTLTMAVQRGLPEVMLTECSQLPFGRCLCGTAAVTGETEFADAADPRHDIRYDGMEPHGHYCIPIKAPKEILGVINLYLEEGCGRDEKDVSFLESVAATMAGIIERHRIQDKLRKSEEKYRAIITTTREGYWRIGKDMKIGDVNESLSLMLGYAREEMIGKCPVDFADERNANIFREQFSKIAATPHRVYEIMLKNRDGGDVPAIIHGTTIRDGEGNPSGAFAFITDVSELKETETRLRRAKEEAEEATNLKDKFVSLVSHDLKNPINLISNYFDLLNVTEQLSDHGKEMVRDGMESCGEMTALISEVLKLSRIRGGKIIPQSSFVTVRGTVELAVKNYCRLAADKGIEIQNEIPEGTRVYADEKLFLEVLRNLLSNAVKFTSEGGRIRLHMPEKGHAVIAVSDTGVGIDPARLGTLFRYEEKTSTRGTAGEAGTGFGLPLCRDIVSAHGGSLDVESGIGKGCTFYIKLPDVKPTLLIVDDDESMLALFRKRLEKLDVAVLESTSGEKALEMMRERRPHLLFIDLHMPGMSGLELLGRIRKEPDMAKTPVVIVTADKAQTILDEAFQKGADDFIVKPFEKEALVECVKRFILV